MTNADKIHQLPAAKHARLLEQMCYDRFVCDGCEIQPICKGAMWDVYDDEEWLRWLESEAEK